jgi:soluble lytic murein transglycosylase-like protein
MWMRFAPILLLAGCLAAHAQQGPGTPAAQPVAPPVQNGSDVAAKQTAAAAAMQASIDKQKAAVRAQVGTGGPADGFFSNPWVTPAALSPPNIVPACDAMQESDLKPIVADAAKAQDVKPELIFAVVKRESASYPCAISEKGAVGLMQLMPDLAAQFGVDPLDPKQNVNAGTQYLKQLMKRYNGDLRLTLAAYNAGPQRVDAEKKVPDIPETTAYVDAILKDLSTIAPSPK